MNCRHCGRPLIEDKSYRELEDAGNGRKIQRTRITIYLHDLGGGIISTACPGTNTNAEPEGTPQ